MTLHEEWTEKLSDFLDGELTPDDRDAVESHLQCCASCAAVLDELTQVVARARTLEGRPPRADLWPGIAARIDRGLSGAAVVRMPARAVRRFAFTLPQLAAASVLIAAMSGGLAWSLRDRVVPSTDRSAEGHPVASRSISPDPSAMERAALAERAAIEPFALADAQYDAAVSDLEKALRQGRGRLDPATITIV